MSGGAPQRTLKTVSTGNIVGMETHLVSVRQGCSMSSPFVWKQTISIDALLFVGSRGICCRSIKMDRGAIVVCYCKLFIFASHLP